ncbi:C4-dicarboxylate transporter DcuC [Flammeovirga kamogawensis]|uniref:C4-dicarboxylate transporter DcuC n=1 Tax=Flammeovirga kamogawensis TaxID=373891 RepID=A0ABX8GSH7_9BACT|nr:C4-dicarboxylate transporter DcuC [Flammeovirga kamogawensis]MBB6463235.1 DcuC family C4-dicarboxylate transporter [Flammeovirga kamogawensis]QWG05915.1 C4-dicarboxylate transporter DcuC [Flammeovirga kamogawensis]TRX67740.1 C4-dicarboxylate ABC transporter [Flammeovirga kamogawensis]
MTFISVIITLLMIGAVAYLLTNKYNPQAVLLSSGVLMMVIALLLGMQLPTLKSSTGLPFFDLFAMIKEVLADKGAKVGLMIMTIGGFVAYMRHIGASDALVFVCTKPLKYMRKTPYFAASCVIPIGQFLFMCTPSATGLGLLLMASIYPVLVQLGISRISAVSVITACTVFDMGPASANTAQASYQIGMDAVQYFLHHQLPLTIPLTIILMLLYFFVNRYYDQKDNLTKEVVENESKEFTVDAPLYYAFLPVMPLVLLMIFSKTFKFFEPPITLDTTTAMLICTATGMVLEGVRKRNLKDTMGSMKIFWEGMGKVFASVVTLIVCAQIFSKGLISLGFIDNLVTGSQNMGLGFEGVSILMTIMIFLASMLMGSGNASFFSFGPLVPTIAAQLGGNKVGMILSMQLASSMGRATSPIAGVIIATAELAGISSFDLAKRNLIPLVVGLISMFALKTVF